jgi:hypothetical protein
MDFLLAMVCQRLRAVWVSPTRGRVCVPALKLIGTKLGGVGGGGWGLPTNQRVTTAHCRGAQRTVCPARL